MSSLDQCPSTKGKKDPKADPASSVNGSSPQGKAMWRSLDEFAGSGEFQPFLEREFPSGASELLKSSRRTFMQIMGGALALAGAATLPGCRRPDHKIMTYSREVPEEVIPGKPLFYASAMPLPGGGAEGVLVRSNVGRPTFVEGNPRHSVSQGSTSSWSIASILSLYDPDRLKQPVFRTAEQERDATWDDFRAWSAGHFAEFDATNGQGLVILADQMTSPTRDAVRDRLRARWPLAQFIAYDPTGRDNKVNGLRLAFGQPHGELLSLENADVIVSVDADPTRYESASLKNSRGFGAARRLDSTSDTMCRIYAAECNYTPLGGMADHREVVAPSRLPVVVVEIAKRVLAATGADVDLLRRLNAWDARGGSPVSVEWLDAVAEDLVEAGGRGVLIAGQTLPAEAHALVAAVNRALGAVGTTVSYVPLDPEAGKDGVGEIAELVGGMRRGRVKTCVVLNSNPCYDLPTELGFEEAFKAVSNRIVLSEGPSETAAHATWQLNAATYLESWGDVAAADGGVSAIQPLIAPLYDGALSEIELLALIAAERDPSEFDIQPAGYDLVRDVWAGRFDWSDFETNWKRTLQNGFAAGKGSPGTEGVSNASVLYRNTAELLGNLRPGAEPTDGALDVVVTINNMYDGRYANLPWLQELPQFGTMVCWDNPALMSPRTAERFGLTPDPYEVKIPKAQMATITVDGRSVDMPVWIMPGMAENTVVLTQGYGRRVCGVVGTGVGFDVQPIRDTSGTRVYTNATVSPAQGKYPISSTQNHWSMESRTSIVRTADLPAFQKHGDEKVKKKDSYGESWKIGFGEMLGELAHTPPNISIYENPYNESQADAAEGSWYSERPQWGVSIDLSLCMGCGACTVACQSENNIPSVGKTEVRKGREMTWLRVDRYFTGDPMNPGELYHQPVACVHCENAPCETVCPVNATVHGPTGLNYMVYNRCIGTRYCANNCPYKVRRFNFFDYGVKRINGGYRDEIPEGTPKPNNINLIPPRLREKLAEIQKMKMNPDVTVRSRGVMEKCTYCIQRINAARYEAKLQDLENIPDGFFQSACHSACATGAIVFGDILDESSRVAKAKKDGRDYALLGYLNTRPRTTYKVAIGNPNPKLREPVVDPFHHHDSHGDDQHGDGHSDDGGGNYGRRGRTLFLDPFKKETDSGYAGSLRVLGAAAGVHA
ncbi:MAG: TAT-variant-translocated molybdopterin oxidoreductase [Planctomycetota bacterium]